jgi:hypothetical protein
MHLRLIQDSPSLDKLFKGLTSTNLATELNCASLNIENTINFALYNIESFSCVGGLMSDIRCVHTKQGKHIFVFIKYAFIEPNYRSSTLEFFIDSFKSQVESFYSNLLLSNELKEDSDLAAFICVCPRIENSMVKDGCGYLLWELSQAVKNIGNTECYLSLSSALIANVFIDGYFVK